MRELGIPASFFMAGFYMSNIPNMLMLRPSPSDNVWTFSAPFSPDTRIPLYDPRDTGKYIKAMVLNEDHFLGKRFTGATAYVSGQEVVDTFKAVFPEAGKTARFAEQTQEEYCAGLSAATGYPEFVVTELYENMRLLEMFGYYGGEPLETSLQYVEDPLTSWADFLKEAEAFAGLK